MNCDFQITEAIDTYRCVRCGSVITTKSGKIRRTCTEPSATPVMHAPSLPAKVSHYVTAVQRWRQAGSPVRSDAEVSAIFEHHCSRCSFYANGICRHESCGCNVGPPDKSSLLLEIAALAGVRQPAQAMTNKLKMATEKCPIGKWPQTRQSAKPRWVTNVDRAAATLRLAAMVPPSVTAVAGVSRSGVSSALQLSELLHLHPFAVSLECRLTPLSHGFRFKGSRADDGDLLIVDDTVASGTSMMRLKMGADRIAGRSRVWYAVTYASSEAAHLVDLHAERLELPHYLEWNFFNSVHSPKTALDFDGILCRDCRPEEDDDGPAYLNFLATAEPLYLPRRCPVPLIVTARLEKYRRETEAWLAKWGVRCERLVMGTWPTIEERRQKYSAAEHKGRTFAESDAAIFVESCPSQARAIFERTGKTVICPATKEVHT